MYSPANFTILYTFVLHAEICTTLLEVYKICEIYVFRILQYFATKLCNFTNFTMLFLAVVVDFVLLA